MLKQPATVCLLAALLLTWLCIRLDTTPAGVVQSPTPDAFSEPQAMAHLQEIAKLPHSTGTPANTTVRNYILNTCAALGLDTSVQHATSVIRQGGGVVAANVYNVIARLKGSSSSKPVLIAAHYDSQPNAGGAGDDGSGCAAMLETARALKAGRPLKNDVIFLFTDDEEDGLLGAEAFVRDNPLQQEIGVMLNFDARGGSGANLLSETNPGNGWVIDGYARSGAHHNASSLNYEVYKRLPNSTDYTPFKDLGVAGLNNAFIDGFVHYHSITDVPANLDPNTLQEEGDNMLAEVRYFGNADIRETKAPDLTFFNLIGNWFIHYPASFNIFFLVGVNALLLVFFVFGFVRKQIRIPGLLSGFLAFPLMLVLLYFISDWTLGAIRVASPLYEGYYSNTYHPGYYFLALTGLGIALFTFVYRWLLLRFSMLSLFAGTLVFLVILLDIVYTLMPTAIYFLCFPLLIQLAGGILIYFRRSAVTGNFSAYGFYPATIAARRSILASSPWLNLVLLIPAILLLAPIFSMFFVAFDLQPTSAAVPALIGILLGLSLPLLAAVFQEFRWLVPGGALALFVVTLTLGLVHSSYTKEEPFKTNLQYVVNATQRKAHWITFASKADSWNKQFFPNPKLVPIATVFPGAFYGIPKLLTNDAPVQDIPAPVLTIRKDSIADGQRIVSFHYEAPGTNSVYFVFGAGNLPANIVPGGSTLRKNLPPKSGYHWFEYKGIPAEGIDFLLHLKPNTPVTIDALSRTIGLPAIQGFNGYPPGIIPGPGNFSNATLVLKKFEF